MSQKSRQALLRAALSLLLAAGLILPLLGAAGLLQSHWAAGLLLPAATALIMGGLSLLPRGGLFSWLGALAGLGIWAALGGAQTVQEAVLGLRLYFGGHTAALPYFLPQAALLGIVLISLAAWAMAGERSSAFFPVMAVMGVLACLWLTDSGSLIWLVFPAAAALLTMIARDRSEAVSAGRVLPFMGALMLLLCLLVPAGGLVSPPLKEAAEDIRQRIMDYFFFTDPREEFSLAREGFYPQGREQLGGPPSLNDDPVMTVETPRTVYLRGAVKNTYTGRSWTDTTGGQRYLWVGARWSQRRAALFDEALPAAGAGEPVSLRITMTRDNASALFAPQRVRSLETGRDLVPYFNDASELFATRNLQEGDTWTLTALADRGEDAGMREILAACAPMADPAADAAAAAVYTGVPGSVQQEVHALTAEAIEGAVTDYDKAMAILHWLQANYRYELNVPARPGYDFVSAFLLSEEKAGYCTYFASAMTVMCRIAGLPARYVEGYAARPGADGVAWVTGRSGHAWVEVWFPGYGWLTFDPTPGEGSGGSQNPPPGESGEPDPQDDPLPEDRSEDQPDPGSDGQDEQENEANDPQEEEAPESAEAPEDAGAAPPPGGPPSLLWLWLLLALLLLALIALLLALRVRACRPERMERKVQDPDARWCLWMQAVCDALRALGEVRPPKLTLAQWLRQVDGKGVTSASLSPLGESAGVIFYGHQEPFDEETAMVRETWTALRDGMTRRQRLRLDLRRAFGRKRDFTVN